jgi:rhamnose transport system ATP-binding protein
LILEESLSRPFLEMRGISKAYGGEQALRGIDLALYLGAVHGLVGENGAGKSTLVKILTGIITADAGTILVNGVPQRIGEPTAARQFGIVAMFQEPTVFEDLSVAENIFAGRHLQNRFRAVDWSAMRTQSSQLLTELGADFGPDSTVRGMGVADRQLIEIAKALSLNAQLLIMDEPTAALSPPEVERLSAIVRRLRDKGTAIVFISHRLGEVSDLADWVTVLRDGCVTTTRPIGQLSQAQMIQQMVGRPLEVLFPKTRSAIGDPILKVEGLERRGVFSGISFHVRRGEILGLAGFVGAGRTEVARTIFGIDHLDSGQLWVGGKPFHPRSPRSALSRGIAYLPEDRLHQGLIQTMSVTTNVSLAVLPSLTPGGVLRPQREEKLAARFINQLRIKTPSRSTIVKSLSGGNQQKVVLSKWLAAQPQVLILDEPTHGVDVATKAEVHRIISTLAGHGLAVVLISSELIEILNMSDRILVMREGRLVAEISRAEATEERIIEAAAGLSQPGVA